MLKKFSSAALLVVTLLFTNLRLINGQTSGGDNAATVDKIKANVTRRGSGEKARVNVKMLNATKLKRFISQAGDDSFTLTDSKTMRTTTIAYNEVAEVKGSGGLSTAAKTGIGVGIAIAITAVVTAASSRGIEGPIRIF